MLLLASFTKMPKEAPTRPVPSVMLVYGGERRGGRRSE
jgi:hypothetical protein